jgi:hypothetical protein
MPIHFTCPDCAEPFSVGDDLAGRKSRCTCGLIITVPQPAVPIQPQPIDPLPGPLLPTPTASNPLMGSLQHGLPTANPLAGTVSTGIPSAALEDKENTGIPVVVKVGAGLSGVGVLGLLLWLGISFLGGGTETGPAVGVETVAGTDLEPEEEDDDEQETTPTEPAAQAPLQQPRKPAVVESQTSAGLTDQQVAAIMEHLVGEFQGTAVVKGPDGRIQEEFPLTNTIRWVEEGISLEMISSEHHQQGRQEMIYTKSYDRENQRFFVTRRLASDPKPKTLNLGAYETYDARTKTFHGVVVEDLTPKFTFTWSMQLIGNDRSIYTTETRSGGNVQSTRIDTLQRVTGLQVPTASNPRGTTVDLTDDEQVTAFIKSIMDLIDAGDYEEAVSKLNWLVGKADTIAAYELRADAYSLWAKELSGDTKTEYCKRAIADYGVVMERNPDKSHLAYERALNYGAIADWDNTIKALATAIQNANNEDREDLARMVNMRAYAFGQAGNQQEADRHKKVEEGIRSGKLQDASSLLFNTFRRYTAEFSNARFVLSLEDDGKYTFFPLGLDYRIKVDKYGNVTGPVGTGIYRLDTRSVVLTASGGGINKGQLQGDNIKIVQSDNDFGKFLVGHVFKYRSPTEFAKFARGQQGGTGNHIKNQQEFFHRFVLALDGGDMDTVMEFTYLGFGPNETRATLQKLGANPVIRRLWRTNGKADPERALYMIKRLTESRDILRKSNFDMESLRFFVLRVPEGQPDDLVANIGDKNGVIFTVYFQDVFMTVNGLKLFNVPTLLRKQ